MSIGADGFGSQNLRPSGLVSTQIGNNTGNDVEIGANSCDEENSVRTILWR
jgi:UDP-3-O-[3-hydroxymyristoyl] glucosamine N-acyltransferase